MRMLLLRPVDPRHAPSSKQGEDAVTTDSFGKSRLVVVPCLVRAREGGGHVEARLGAVEDPLGSAIVLEQALHLSSQRRVVATASFEPVGKLVGGLVAGLQEQLLDPCVSEPLGGLSGHVPVAIRRWSQARAVTQSRSTVLVPMPRAVAISGVLIPP